MLHIKRLSIFAMVLGILLMPMLAMAQAPVQIAYGQVVTGEISQDNPSDSYSFFGSQGETIIIRMNATGNSGLDSFLRLLDPRGNDYYSDDDSGGNRNALLGPIVLSETGTYTIIASSCCTSEVANSIGTYQLVVEQAEVPLLNIDQPITITMGEENPTAFFSILSDSMPSPIARLVLTVTSGNMTGASIGIEVRGPIGGYFYSNYAPSGSTTYSVDPIITDLAGGAYLVVVRLFADNFGAPLPQISAELVVNSLQAVPLVQNTPVSGTLNDANPVAYYSFEGDMGGILSLVGEQNTQDTPISVTVYAPGGISFTGASTMNYMDGSNYGTFSIDPLRTLNTGVYYIAVSRAIYDNPQEIQGTTSPFTLTLSATATPLLQVGVPVTGVFDNPNEYQQTYRYQATANQTIRITLRSLNSSYAPSFDLQGDAFESADMMLTSHNAIVPGTYIFEVTLYYDTIYILNVRNGIFFPMGDSLGEYSLQIDVIR